MRIKTIVLVLIAMVCGLLATIGISQVIDRQGKAGQTGETVKIFVAAADVNISDALTTQNVRLEEWPKDRVPEGAITRLEDLENRYARQRLFPGEPIMEVKLMDSNSDTTMTIPEGYRACSIKVSGEVVVGNLVKPGDRVDVIVFLRKGGDVPLTGTRTILRDVRVFAVNAKTERESDDEGQGSAATTVSLLVTPKQVELLTLASQLGQMRLSLRRPNDNAEDKADGTTVEAFMQDTEYGGVASLPPIDPTKAVEGASDLVSWLSTQTAKAAEATAPSTASTSPVSATVVDEVQFTMDVLTSQGMRRYEWTDESKLPRTVDVSSGEPVSGADFQTAAPAPPTGDSPEPKSSSWLDSSKGTEVNVP